MVHRVTTMVPTLSAASEGQINACSWISCRCSDGGAYDGPRKANVTYRWTTGALAADYSALAPTLVVTDAAEASGGASVNAPCSLLLGPPCAYTDNGIVSFFSDILPPGQASAHCWWNVTTNPDGTLSGSITEQGQDEDFIASGSEYSWTVTEVVGNEGYIQNCRSCTATGYF